MSELIDSDNDLEKNLITPLLVCNLCDTNSSVEHVIQITRFRVANLCCAGEERIILSTLNGIVGIDSVTVNVIGRYVVVKHCNIACCAPAERIVDILNEKKLGVSIQDANADDAPAESTPEYGRIAHMILVSIIFFLGIIFEFARMDKLCHMITFLISTSIGLFPILEGARISIIRRTIDIHILMVVAVSGAIASEEYLEAALVVNLFIVAELIESEVMRRVRNALNVSVGSMNKTATLAGGAVVNVDTLHIRDVIAVRAGEMIMADGEVKLGQAVIDESALTGEAVPISKKRGDKVISGTVVQNGYLEIEITTEQNDSTLRKLNQAVKDVQADKGNFERIVDRFAEYWTPVVLVSAVTMGCVGGYASGNWHHWLHRSLVLLVLACPCSLVIAAPIPSVCAIAVGAKNGVLIKGSSVVEALGVVNVFATDKTGTLTKGFFSVIASERIADVEDGDDYNVMALAAALENKSSHPVANAIVTAYTGCIAEFTEEFAEVKKVNVVNGVGVEGWVRYNDDWHHMAIGNERLLKENGGKAKPTKNDMTKISNFLQRYAEVMVLYITVDDKIIQMIALADEVRPQAAQMVSNMKQMGFNVTMLTGDQDKVARQVCRVCDITDCKSRLLPHEKLNCIREMDKMGHGCIMLGDGINDASALAASSVGIAMGAGGSAMAVVAADCVIMSENLLRVPATIRVCRRARNFIIFNCVFSVAVKVIAIVLAVLGKLELWEAVLFDVGALLVVVTLGSSVMLDRSYQKVLEVVDFAVYSPLPAKTTATRTTYGEKGKSTGHMTNLNKDFDERPRQLSSHML